MTAAIFTVRLQPHGGSFECSSEEPLLDAAIAAGYWLPHSCREGSCHTCLLRVVDGAVRSEFAQETAGIESGWCLTCQSRPSSDVTLDAPTVPATPGQRVVQAGARVSEVHRPTEDVAIVRLQLPAGSGFAFQPGQYAEVVMRDGQRRSYSMANRPDDQGTIEWHVRRMPNGRFSEHAYSKLKARDLLRIEGPFGVFALHADTRPIVFLASGTGYAPIASMLASHADEIAARGATLYWGGRRLPDLYALDDADAWQSQHPGVRIVPVLSEAGEGWAGRSGLVHLAVLEDFPDLSRHVVYACGNPLMIDAARSDFTARAGLPAEEFYCDAFFARG